MPRTVYYFYHHRRASYFYKGVLRCTPLLCKHWIVPCNAGATTSTKSMSSLNKITSRASETNRTMQDMKISSRLRLIRPGDTKSWPYSVDPNKVLVIFLPWLNSKEKHVSKYVQLYLDIGLDVLCLKSKTQDFLWPPKSFALAEELSEVLKQCRHYDYYLIHSMSIGSYNLTTFRVLAKDVQEVSELNQKVCGIIYDSIVIGAGKGGALEKTENGADDDGKAIDRFVRGMAASVNKNRVFLSLVSLVSRAYFGLTRKKTLDYYERAYDVVRDEPAKVPTLVLTSKNDPMCDKDVIEQIVKIWENLDVPVSLQMWDESGHAQHLVFHRKEYINTQRNFLDDVFSGMDKDVEISKIQTVSKL